ncbi:MAG: restriction endonuclease subunit S [Streptococcus salivarius]
MTRMKESGIDWIGQIPEEWRVTKLKYALLISNGKDYKDIEVEEGGYPVIGSGGVFARARNYMYDGDVVLLGRKGTIDKPLFYSGKFWTVDTMFYSTALNGNNIKFMYYSSLLIPFSYYSTATALPSMTQSDLNNHVLCLPSISEQQKIADFLDKKTAQLDKAKALLEEQIQKLKDYRASLIYETVTKGLDKTVPMKDSGIDWIGQVPQGWGVDFANHIFEEHKQKNKGNKEKNLLSLSYGRIIRKSIDTSFGLLPESFDTYNIIQRGDIVLRLTDLQNDKRSLRVGLARENGIITSAYLTLRLKSIGCSDSYMYYLLHTYDICKVFYNFGGGVRQGGTWSDIYKLKLLIPPYNEQTKITDFLDKKTVQIDKLIKIKNQQIKNINRQRQTLIYDYVTGKRRV